MILAILPGAFAAASPTIKKSKPLPSVGEFFRFADPTTEATVVRLTNPASTSLLPAPTNRFISVKDRFLLFSSDRDGGMMPYRLNLRNGALTQIARTANLVPHSLCMAEGERSVYLLDGGTLKEVDLANRRERTLAEDVSAFSSGTSPAEFVVVRKGRLEQLNGNSGPPLAEDVSPQCLVRPGGKGCLFERTAGQEREFWYASFPSAPAANEQPQLLAKGISDPFWSMDGQSLLFLRDVPAPNIVLSEIHEISPETRVEKRVARTSQFAAFAPNLNGSVFVGASRSKAQPTVMLLLRAVQREFTLCEHRASHPASVSPVFSPDSRRVYFQSDHQGKSALYSVNVELLVDPT